MPNPASMFGQRRHRAPKSPAFGKKNKRGGSKIRPQPDSKVRHGDVAGRPKTTSARRSWKTGTGSEPRKIATSPSHESAPPRFFNVITDDRQEGTTTLAKAKFNTVYECSSDSEVESIIDEDFADRLNSLRFHSIVGDLLIPRIPRIPSPNMWAPADRVFEKLPAVCPSYIGPNTFF